MPITRAARLVVSAGEHHLRQRRSLKGAILLALADTMGGFFVGSGTCDDESAGG